MVGPWVGARLQTGPTGGVGGGSVLARYTFDTNTANADGYVSEAGAKALSLWAGGASTSGGLFIPATNGLTRARFNAGQQPGYWKLVFIVPNPILNFEAYVDLRDNLTSRLSVAVDSVHIYLFDGYTSTTIDSTGLSPVAGATYTLEVTDVGNLVSGYLNGALRVSGSTTSGAGATRGGVTINNVITNVDTLEAQA